MGFKPRPKILTREQKLERALYELREALGTYADSNNWTREEHSCYDCHCPQYYDVFSANAGDGWEIAQDAMDLVEDLLKGE